MCKRLVVIAMTAGLLGACGDLPDPPSPSGDQLDEGNGADPKDDPDDYTPPADDDPPPPPPDVAGLPSQYGYDTVPVHGQAVRYATVFVEGGSAPVATDAASDGYFCVDVPLTPSTTQTLEVYAQDARGETSEPTLITIHHDPDLAETFVPEQPLVDLAPGQDVFADQTPKEGALSAITDDDPTTSVTVPKTRIWVDLGDWYDIESIEIEFPDAPGAGEDTFATEYQVLASDEAAPTLPPDEDELGWDLLYDVYPGSFVPAGDGGVDTFELPTPMNARYVAFYLIENNKVDWFDSENIRVSNIKITGRSTEALPATLLTPTCENNESP